MSIQNVSNLVTAIATVILSIFNVVYVRLIYSQIRDNLRPYVHANIEEIGHDVFFVIRNTGKTAALNVKIETSPSLTELHLNQFDGRFAVEPFLQQPVIAPLTEIRTRVCDSMYAGTYVNQPGKGTFTTSILYNGEDLKRYQAHYVISVSSIVYDHLYDEDKITKSAVRISESLETIASQLKEG